MLKKLKIKGNETIYVGDNPKNDFENSKKIMHTVHIIRKNGEYKNVSVNHDKEAEFKIKNLSKIEKIVDDINEKI